MTKDTLKHNTLFFVSLQFIKVAESVIHGRIGSNIFLGQMANLVLVTKGEDYALLTVSSY